MALSPICLGDRAEHHGPCTEKRAELPSGVGFQNFSTFFFCSTLTTSKEKRKKKKAIFLPILYNLFF